MALRLLIASTLLAFTAIAPSLAQAAIEHRIEIEQQQLGTALTELARQTKIQVVYPTELVEGHRVLALTGSMTPEQALDRLLVHTGLRYEFLDEKTVTLSRADGSSASLPLQEEGGALRTREQPREQDPSVVTGEGRDPRSGKGEGLWQRFRLAQAETASSSDASSNISGPPKVTLEEVIVTAQKRKEVLQDVPISISVLTGEQLDSSSFLGAIDAIRSLPGVDVYESQYSGGVTFSVRGVSSPGGLFGGSGVVAYYMDGVPYGFIRNPIYPDTNAYDLERIELLNGPQGTLYGASALSGVVRILTHNANADTFELKARGGFSSTEGGTDGYRGDLAVNVPLIEGRLGVRAVVGYQYDGGWIDARPLATGAVLCGPDGYTTDSSVGVTCPNRDDINDARKRNYRLKVHAQPSDTLSVDLTAWRADDDVGAPGFSQDDGTVRVALLQNGSSTFSSYGATVVKEFSAFSLTSMTSYLDFEGRGTVSGEPPPISVPVIQETRLDARVFAQEFNLLSSIEGPWSWTAGAFYRDDKDVSFDQYYVPFHDGSSWDGYQETLDDITDTSKSYAVFGGIQRRFFNNQLEAAVALRYFHDKEVMTLNSAYPTSGTLVPGDSFETISEAWTPRAILTWKPTPDQMAYLSYGQGFRSGFSQTPLVQSQTANFPLLKPDKLSNYEIGTKASVFGGRLSYEAALFYIDWQDAQVSNNTLVYTDIGVPLLVIGVTNTGSNKGPGASFGLTVRPLRGLALSPNVSCNHLKSDETTQATQAGQRLPNSPECTYGASAQYEWALGSGFQARVGLSGSYKGRAQGDQRITDATGTIHRLQSDEIIRADAQLAIESSHHWSAMLYGNNLTNDDGSPGHAFDIPGGTSADWSGRSRPRTFGVQLEYDFK